LGFSMKKRCGIARQTLPMTVCIRSQT